jgi:4-amino-4-deoxy-L-arabinose transferase-like glycosyltransferase
MPRQRVLQVTVLLLILSVFVSPARRDLFVGDETKYGEVVREMRASGAVFLPTLGGAPFTHKPPPHFWMIDLLTYPLGLYSTWAFVLPSIAAFAFLLWLMWRMGGPLAAYVCGTSLLVWGSAQTARMDVMFTALIALGLWQMQRGKLLWCGAALGVATLIKGPMAIVIGVVLYLLEAWRRRPSPGASRHPLPADAGRGALDVESPSPRLRGEGARRDEGLALLVMIAIPLLWFIPAVILGGRGYAHDVVVKQTVGRAVASWVHQAPPWFYLERLPLALFPWFFLAVAAAVALWRTQRFLVNWILAVLIPYSLMSSKLDVYMMAMIPAIALLIAEGVRAGVRWVRAANIVAIALVLVGAIVGGAKIPREFASVGGINALIAFTLVVSVIGLIVAARASLVTSTIVAGAVPILVLLFTVDRLMPFINGFGSTQTLVTVLERQHVEPERIALYSSPYLWTRDFPRPLERVVYADPQTLQRTHPLVIVTSRAHANEIAPALAGCRKVDEVRMIGKWFDVYKR